MIASREELLFPKMRHETEEEVGWNGVSSSLEYDSYNSGDLPTWPTLARGCLSGMIERSVDIADDEWLT